MNSITDPQLELPLTITISVLGHEVSIILDSLEDLRDPELNSYGNPICTVVGLADLYGVPFEVVGFLGRYLDEMMDVLRCGRAGSGGIPWPVNCGLAEPSLHTDGSYGSSGDYSSDGLVGIHDNL